MRKRIIILFVFLLLFMSGLIFYEKKSKESFYKKNWGYHFLNIDTLHTEYGLTGKNVKVALIDTGISDKALNIDVVEGINVIDNSDDFTDDHGHGTHITGLLASKKIGVAPDIELYVAKALNNTLRGEMTDIVKAVEWAINKNVDIILMPFGTFEDSKELKMLIDKAVLDEDILVVSSVGNYGLKENIDIMYPAKYDNVIAVGALDKKNKVWKGTTLGEELDYLLPGQYINSYSTTGDSLISSGTSMASAYMAGILALYVEKHRNVNINFNRSILSKDNKYRKIDGYEVMNPFKILE
ncbi:S8 family serine peptidase [Rossellomorea aquimaris]|uniref:S8 family serine peptidase n=1 Tax=Rossellomorea aquimaris TaxID=189382 RepID=UPI001CD48551|nr:S8 family serine peptidase [Rossellomorea aquimaris]MCA1060306.1 S8 family serine peptidase [Rossellomorea aquimaris]